MADEECFSCGYAAKNGHAPHCLWGHTVEAPRPEVAEVRPTSVAAYVAAEESGELPGQRETVWRFLHRNGPSTGREVDHGLAEAGDAAASFHKRLPELRDLGLAEEDGERPCRITGRMAIAWKAKDWIVLTGTLRARVSRLEALAREFEQDPERRWSGVEVAATLRGTRRAAA